LEVGADAGGVGLAVKAGGPVDEAPAFARGGEQVGGGVDVLFEAREDLQDVGALRLQEGEVAGVGVEGVERGKPEGAVAGDAVDVLRGAGGDGFECDVDL
jgi:hypothetical protein